MKNYINFILTLLVIMVSVSSCSDDYLEEISPNGVSTDTFWSTLEETEATVTSMYAGLLRQELWNSAVDAIRSDMGHPGTRQNIQTRNAEWYSHSYTAGTSEVSWKWNAMYQVIFRANQVIEGLINMENVTSQETWELQMAQARFFRGLMHFYLHSTYNEGRIVIRDKVPSSNEEINKGVSESADVIAFFREDLQYAYDNLPPSYAGFANASQHEGRVTASVAGHVLGTSYMYEEEYNAAIPYFEDVINNGAYGHELQQDMSMMFTNAGEYNPEILFEITHSIDVQIEDIQWDYGSFSTRLARAFSPQGVGGNNQRGAYPAAWLAETYMNEAMDSQDSRNTVNDIETGLSRERSVSLRGSSMVFLFEDFDTEVYQQPNLANTTANAGGYLFSYFKKFSNHDLYSDENDSPAPNAWFSGKNLIVYRLAETYINLAECKLMGAQDVNGALASLNTLRARWGLVRLGIDNGSGPDFDGVTYDVNSLMDQIMFVEKPLECSVEGYDLRWIDLRRWGITQQRFTELAADDWSLEGLDYYRVSDGTTQTRGNTHLVRGTGGTAFKEYDLASQLFIPDVHNYLPIPLSETQNNSSID